MVRVALSQTRIAGVDGSGAVGVCACRFPMVKRTSPRFTDIFTQANGNEVQGYAFRPFEKLALFAALAVHHLRNNICYAMSHL